MASFQDSSQLPVSQYIGAIDPQVYAAVGAQKQAQYNAGVQKINGLLETVAGIQVVKDAHKQYLGEAVNSLQTDVQKLAGGDFSNQQLVNQALSLGSRISKDPVIQNAVLSTANYQKAFAAKDKYKQEGKSSVENDRYFDKQVQAWLSDGDTSSTFKASYNPYVNITKDFTEFYKVLEPDSTLRQEDFIVNGTNISLTRETATKGISPDKINQAWNLFSQRGDIRNQMRINADYLYEGYDRNVMLGAVERDKQVIVESTNRKIQELQASLATDKTANAVVINDTIKQLEQQNAEIISNLDTLRSLDDTTIKERMYEESFRHNLMNTFSYSDKSNKVIESPFEKAKRDQLDYELKVQQYQEKKDETDRKGLPNTQVVQRNNAAEEGKLGEASFKQALSASKTELSNETKKHINSIAGFSGKKAPWRLGTNGEYIPNVGPMGYSSAQEAQSTNDILYSEAKISYDNGKATHPVKAMFAETDGLQRAVKAMETKNAEIARSYDIQRYISENVGNVAQQYPTLQNYLSTGKSIEMKDPSTNKVLGQMPFADLIKLATAIELKGTAAESAKTELLQKYPNFDMATLKASLYFQPEVKKLYGNVRDVIQKSPEITEIVNQREQSYKDAQRAYISYNENFITSKPEEYKNVENRVRSVVGQIAAGKQDGKGEYSDFLEAVEDGTKDNSNIYGYYYNRLNNQTYLTLQKKDGEILEVPVSSSQATLIPGIKITDEFNSKFGADLSLTQNMTTDITGTGANAYSVVGNPNNKYDVKYHLNGLGDGTFMLKLYVWDENGNSVLSGAPYSAVPSKGYMTNNQIIEAVRGLGDDNIINAIIQNNSSNNR